jgi:hypothetical protein
MLDRRADPKPITARVPASVLRECPGANCTLLTRWAGAISNDSVFDLSPSEKLQLVYDLWDDLAASDAVPVHDWQKEALGHRTG